MKRWIYILITSLLLVLFVGCTSSVNPETGEKVYSMDPNTGLAIESGAAAGVTLLGVLSIFIPALIPVSTAAGGALAAWLKLRPKLEESREERALYHDIGLALVDGVEEYKKRDPENAAKLLVILETTKNKIINPNDLANIEAMIRGLRGLAPKD